MTNQTPKPDATVSVPVSKLLHLSAGVEVMAGGILRSDAATALNYEHEMLGYIAYQLRKVASAGGDNDEK